MDILIVTLASLFAGFVDAIVGGGGLILVPALFAVFPTAHPATLFGTNKSASIWGSLFASLQYSRRVKLPYAALLPAVLMAFIGAFLGAWLVTIIAPFLRKSLPFMLFAILLYTFAKKDLGHHHAPRLQAAHEIWAICSIGLVLGFTMVSLARARQAFWFLRWCVFLGYDFLNASASAKLLNVATNLAALILFSLKGHVWWDMALPMALANIAGSLLGTRLALKHGTGFVRVMFLLVVSALICKTSYDAFLK
ncbi:MAG: TSUP family transporter [Polaromonas sp.]|nr:TSUP family transporter [Polaromonas sp.]